MQTEENRNRMWTVIFLYILGQHICQATEDNSTQMYYVKLTIDESAIDNITELLKPFVNDNNLQVTNLAITTTCQNVSDRTVCTCKPNYRWSDSVCKSNQTCCGGNCTFPQNSAHMCIFNTSVAVNGSLILNGSIYADCLKDKTNADYNICDDNLTIQMKSVYSTLMGFDSLTILQYSVGSVIATFQMTFAYGVSPQDLITKSETLNINLSATLYLVTTGVVTLSMPDNPVYYNSKHTLECTLQKDLDIQPTWQLKTTNNIFNITNGTGAEVTWTTRSTKVDLKQITELWAGTYTCAYLQQLNSTTIRHQASALMDVCLKPNIYISLDPQYPRCKSNSDILTVITTCQIGDNTENYTVKWDAKNILTQLPPQNSSSGVYTVKTHVKCDPTIGTPQVNCTFVNRCNQTTTASIDINIIQANGKLCLADGDWQDTKAGFTAVLQCTGAAGLRKRTCTDGETWNQEVSACVNQVLNNVLQSAFIVDIGLGRKDDNAADVFLRLKNVTNNTQSINTFSNMNASVQVLSSLSQKQLNPNESAFKDFLVSSSNVLDTSLGNSWMADNHNNVSLAETYLKSVEVIIHGSQISNSTFNQTNIQVAIPNCTLCSNSNNTVFNIMVSLDSQDYGSVKMAAFKELEKYFPNNSYNNQTANSHIVSITTERQTPSVEVKIMFPLLTPRPRNVNMTCVYWDFNTSTWSPDGCKWLGSTNEGTCVCEHMSSFAILMSKYPLEIPALTEITYAGLSISVLSLTITLVIELIVWSQVVKTNTLYLRHTAHVNISLCLLVADCCFLASSDPRQITEIWCVTFVVVKHFCYLSMFFWMLCLSSTLLHQSVYLFHNVSKKNYLRFSLVVGYVCPLLIVVITFLTNNGAEGQYYSKETCWLVYSGLLKGTIYTFVIPVGIIVFVNVFSMLVVIMKLLDHPKNTDKSHEKEKKAALTVMRSVILLTPIFGVTWIFGFAVMLLDLTSGTIAYAANYAFTLLNAFQGLFILLTTCLGDKLTREALLKRLKSKDPASTIDTSTKFESSVSK